MLTYLELLGFSHTLHIMVVNNRSKFGACDIAIHKLKLGILQFQPRGFRSHDGRAARVPVTQRSGGKTQQKNRRKKKEKKKNPECKGAKLGNIIQMNYV